MTERLEDDMLIERALRTHYQQEADTLLTSSEMWARLSPLPAQHAQRRSRLRDWLTVLSPRFASKAYMDTKRPHASQMIDLQQDRASVRQQPLSLESKSQRDTDPQLVALGGPRRLPSKKSWLLATVAALVVAFLGTGFAGPFSQWFGGTTSAPIAYAAINQSMQTAEGIKFTATKGYADPKHLVLYYDVQLPNALASKNLDAFVVKSTLQNGNAGSSCRRDIKGSSHVDHCVIVFPSSGDIAGDTLKVTWNVSEVQLTPIDYRPGTSAPFYQGNWTLQFSLPFHHTAQTPLMILPPK